MGKTKAQTNAKKPAPPAQKQTAKAPEQETGPMRPAHGADAGMDKQGASPRAQRAAALQRQMGNSRLNRQALAVSKPDDASEKEASAMGRQVAAGEKTPPVKPVPASEASPLRRMFRLRRQAIAEEEELVQKQAAGGQKGPVQHRAAADEKKPVQKQAAAEEKKPVQKQAAADEKKPVQKQAAAGEKEPVKEKKPIQRQPEADAGAGLDTEQAAESMEKSGGGRSLNPEVRQKLEANLGADLSGVQVHDDSAANEAAAAIQARAFTRGYDIYLGRGESEHDIDLMAHEAVHVAQQQAGAMQRQVVRRQVALARQESISSAGEGAPPDTDESTGVQLVQRAGDKAGGKGGASAGNPPADVSSDPNQYSSKKGDIDISSTNRQVRIREIQVPAFKAPYSKPPMIRPKAERSNQQVEVWEGAAKKGAGLDKALQNKLKQENSPRSNQKNGKPIYYLRLKKEDNYVIGDEDTIKQRVLRPFWDEKGQREFYDVDHKKEYQLGGADKDINNLWLLEASANRSSGSTINTEIRSSVDAILTEAREKKLGKRTPDLDTVFTSYTIEIQAAKPASSKETSNTWTLDQVKDGLPLEGLRALSKKEIAAAGLEGDPGKLAIYTNPTGGGLRTVPWGKGKTVSGLSVRIGRNFEINSITYEKGKGGTATGLAFGEIKHEGKSVFKNKEGLEIDVVLQETDAVDYGGYITQASVSKSLKKTAVELNLFSPISFDDVTLDPEKGIVVGGKITSTIPLLKGTEIAFFIDGNELVASATFSAGDFKFPGPVEVTDSSLELSLGTERGLQVKGDVFFEVPRMGKGQIGASAKTGVGKGADAGFAIYGTFDFDSTLFEPAQINMKYEKEIFSGSGKLGIKKGKVKGIKNATLTVEVEGERWEASGTIEPDIKGIQQGTLSVKHNPETGMEVAGTLQFSKEMPGIKSGSLEAKLTKKEGEEGWRVKASGNAQLDIPGVDTAITADYDDGLFLAQGTVGYQRGMLKGSLTAGVTNRPIDAEGRPTAGEPTETLSAFGSGQVSIRIAPWLQGTIGVKIKPNGEVEVTGEVALPDSLPIFDRIGINKQLFRTPPIDIPILGFSAMGYRVGIFASISGGLDFTAGIGPGQLTDLGLKVTYNPDREQDTRVEGRAKVRVPADAGLRLSIRGEIGVGLAVASASGYLEVGAMLGVAGALEAGVNVNWTPAQGLKLDAVAEIYAEPKFRFDVRAGVSVQLHLLATFNVYDKSWELAAFEFGSGLRFGLKFPFHYEQGQPVNISWDQLDVTVPDIQVKPLLGSLVDRVIG